MSLLGTGGLLKVCPPNACHYLYKRTPLVLWGECLVSKGALRPSAYPSSRKLPPRGQRVRFVKLGVGEALGPWTVSQGLGPPGKHCCLMKHMLLVSPNCTQGPFTFPSPALEHTQDTHSGEDPQHPFPQRDWNLGGKCELRK